MQLPDEFVQWILVRGVQRGLLRRWIADGRRLAADVVRRLMPQVKRFLAEDRTQSCDQVFQLDGGACAAQADERVEMDAAPRPGFQPDLCLRVVQLDLSCQSVLKVPFGVKDQAPCRQIGQGAD
jgi:hypothetical protein